MRLQHNQSLIEAPFSPAGFDEGVVPETPGPGTCSNIHSVSNPVCQAVSGLFESNAVWQLTVSHASLVTILYAHECQVSATRPVLLQLYCRYLHLPYSLWGHNSSLILEERPQAAVRTYNWDDHACALYEGAVLLPTHATAPFNVTSGVPTA